MSIQLMVETGPLAGQYWVFDQPASVLVGRESGVDIRLGRDASASRRHARFDFAPPRAAVRDLGSLNGLFVNGRHLVGAGALPEGVPAETVNLVHGDRVQIGLSVFRVFVPYCRDCDAEIPPPFPPAGVLRCPNCRANAATSSGGLSRSAALRRRAGLSGGAPPPELPDLEVLQLLSRGATGEVYLARRGEDGTLLTIKALRQPPEHPGATDNFLRRIAAFRAMEHPHLVRLHDGGVLNRQWFTVREYVPGWTLEGWRLAHPKKRLSWDELRPFLRQALAGLAHMHELGEVHLRLQPSHFFLDASRTTPLLKLADPDLTGRRDVAGHDLLMVDAVAGGAMAYVAPEQAADFQAGGMAADVFALAASFYTALTGAPAYDFSDASSDPLSVLLEGRISPVAARGVDLPAGLAAWLDRSLSLDPSARYPNAPAMRQALLEIR